MLSQGRAFRDQFPSSAFAEPSLLLGWLLVVSFLWASLTPFRCH
jgi:hypothetical protein